MEPYLSTTIDVYKKAAEQPDVGLCCTTSPAWSFPGLKVPSKMLEMNYGCGSTVHPRDLTNEPTVVYVGVGGGMELLQFAYFNRKKGEIIGVDVVDEMLDVCQKNLRQASKENAWFDPLFVDLRKGSALELPVEDESVDVAAQNCLFNIFLQDDLYKALTEMFRVLKPHGRLILSDPICDQRIPDKLKNDAKLRALCLSGALPLHEYINMITNIGFGTIEVRAKYPYRVLSKEEYGIDSNIFIESVEICAIKDPMPEDGPCIFTGRSALYYGPEAYFDDQKGHLLVKNQPLAICDKTAESLAELSIENLLLTPSTYYYNGGGCC